MLSSLQIAALLGVTLAHAAAPPMSLQLRALESVHGIAAAGTDVLALGLDASRGRDWLVLAGDGTCLNHDLRFGPCGAGSGWDAGPQRVALGARCLSSGGLAGGGLVLVPCGAAAEGRALGAREGRLCAGAACERCASAHVSTPGATLEDGCASVLVMRSPRRWFALLAALLLAM